ncbi:hypothetical protein HY450_00095 [Candidatus Pacearchaeota archaeon]|nr:hypothetical protein [Candidatus Pacearchaeota archaeon]
MINEKNLEKTKKLIKNQTGLIIVKAQDYNYNRKILDYGKFDVLLSPEDNSLNDKLKQLNSGLDHIMAKTAAKRGIAIGVDLSEILKLEKMEKANRLSRIKSNIASARKANCKIIVLNYKDKKDVFNLLISLGASTKQATEAVPQ